MVTRSRPHRSIRLLALILVAGVVACTAATPPPTTAPTSTLRPTPSAPTQSPTPIISAASPSPSAGASREPRGDFGREITIGSLDSAWTSGMLEFASDGEAVIFSKGEPDDGDHAPDLWRYHPSADAPELLWANPRRDRSLVKIAGEVGTWAFVSMPVIPGEIAWDFWLLPEVGAEPILLDSHPGDSSIPDFVPSFTVHQDQITWASFDLAATGPVSQLWYARAPGWEPTLLVERDARKAELWLPSMRDTRIVYCEVVYSADRTTDERHVYMTDAAQPELGHRRLDTSGRATMPLLLINGGVVWKEAEPGMNMFNWGTLFHYDEVTDEVSPLPMQPQDFVNYPSAGDRFVAAWGSSSLEFGVYDLQFDEPRLIDRFTDEENTAFLRPHLSWSLLVWLHAPATGGGVAEVRFAFLPVAGADRGG